MQQSRSGRNRIVGLCPDCAIVAVETRFIGCFGHYQRREMITTSRNPGALAVTKRTSRTSSADEAKRGAINEIIGDGKAIRMFFASNRHASARIGDSRSDADLRCSCAQYRAVGQSYKA